MLINRDGFLMSSVSVNVLTEVVAGPAAQPRLTEVGRQPNRLGGGFEKVTIKFFLQVVEAAGRWGEERPAAGERVRESTGGEGTSAGAGRGGVQARRRAACVRSSHSVHALKVAFPFFMSVTYQTRRRVETEARRLCFTH
jgi:hypothetical protein